MKFFFIVRSLVIALIGVGLSYVRLLPIVGSFFGSFSTHAILFPTSGLVGGPLAIGIYFALRMTLCNIALHKAICYQLLNNLGGIAANISWHSNKIINLLLLLACFVLFVIHPLGCQVPLYTLYWLIPAFLIITNQQSLFCRSFTATWMSHAVGSIVWLYTHEINITEWIFLTINPLVIGERILFALGIMICYHALLFTQYWLSFFAKQYFSRETKAIA